MYLCFVDESGDVNPDQSVSSDYFMRCAIVCHEKTWHNLHKIFKDVKKFWSIPEDCELHATEIIRGEGFYHGFSLAKRKALLKDILQRLSRKKNITLLAVIFDKADLTTTKSVKNKSRKDKMYFLRNHSWEFLCERFNYVIKLENKNNNLKDKGLIISDWCGHKDDRIAMKHLSNAMKKSRPHINRSNLIETISYADSSQSELLQLADCINYAVQRKFNQKDNYFFKFIKPKFFKVKGKVEGFGLKIWNKPVPYPSNLV